MAGQLIVPKGMPRQIRLLETPEDCPIATHETANLVRREDIYRDFSVRKVLAGGAPTLHADMAMAYQVMSVGPGEWTGNGFIPPMVNHEDIVWANAWNGGCEMMIGRRRYQRFVTQDLLMRTNSEQQDLPEPLGDSILTRPDEAAMAKAIYGDLVGHNGKAIAIATVDDVDGQAMEEGTDPQRYVIERVVAVGPGREGKPPVGCRVGDLVVFTKGHSTMPMMWKGRRFTGLCWDHVYSVLR